MLFSHRQKKNRRRHHAWLYSAVFTGRLSTLLILILFSSFLLQPFHKAIASEVIEITEEVPEPVAEDVQLEDTAVPEELPEEEVISEEVEEPPPEPEPDPPEVPEVAIENDNQTESETEIETPPESTGGDIVSEDNATTTDQVEEPLEENSGGEVVEVQYLVTEENYYQFNKNACVLVGDGAFHCSTNTKNELDAQSVVYAEQGPSGNMEIFLKTSRGNVKQITENAVDDTAPHYDPESMRVVWQRLDRRSLSNCPL